MHAGSDAGTDRKAFLDVVLLRYPEKSDVIRDEQQSWLKEFLDTPAPVVAAAPALAIAPTAPVVAAAVPAPAAVKAADVLKDDGKLAVGVGVDGDVVQIKSLDREANRFKIAPKVGFFFNDPSGAFRYSISAMANYDRRLFEGAISGPITDWMQFRLAANWDKQTKGWFENVANWDFADAQMAADRRAVLSVFQCRRAPQHERGTLCHPLRFRGDMP